MRLSAVCIAGIVLVLMAGPVVAEEPVSPQPSPRVLPARRARKFDAGGIVISPKNKENAVYTVVHLGGISAEKFGEASAKKKPSLTCEEQDCRLAATISGGKKRPTIGILLVFETPKDAQRCILSIGDYDALHFVAESEIRESISSTEALR